MRKIVIREIDSMTLFKFSYIIFSFIGFFIGLLYLISAFFTFGFLGDFPGGAERLYIILRSSLGMMLLFILFGIISSFGVLILAKIYNLLSRRIGGIAFYLEDEQVDKMPSRVSVPGL